MPSSTTCEKIRDCSAAGTSSNTVMRKLTDQFISHKMHLISVQFIKALPLLLLVVFARSQSYSPCSEIFSSYFCDTSYRVNPDFSRAREDYTLKQRAFRAQPCSMWSALAHGHQST